MHFESLRLTLGYQLRSFNISMRIRCAKIDADGLGDPALDTGGWSPRMTRAPVLLSRVTSTAHIVPALVVSGGIGYIPMWTRQSWERHSSGFGAPIVRDLFGIARALNVRFSAVEHSADGVADDTNRGERG